MSCSQNFLKADVNAVFPYSLEQFLFKIVFSTLILLLWSEPLSGQEFPNHFRGTYQSLSDSSYNEARMIRLERHLFKLSEGHKDSLADYFLPLYNEYRLSQSPAIQEAILESMLILSYQVLGDLELSAQYLEARIAILQTINDDARLSVALSQLMFLQKDMDRREEALATSVKLREIMDSSKSLKVPNILFLYRQLCGFYQQVGQYDIGFDLCNKGIELSLDEENYGRLPGMYEAIALMHEASDEQSDSIGINHNKAIKWAIHNGDSFNLRTYYRNMARFKVRLGDSDSAEYYFQKTFELYANHPYLFGWIADQRSYAEFLLGENRQEEAEKVYRELSKRLAEFKNHEPSLRHLYSLGMQIMTLRSHLDSFRYYNALNDSLLLSRWERDKAEAQEELLVEYEVKQREAENRVLKERNRSILIGLIATSIVVVLLIVVVYTRSQKRKTEKIFYKQKQELMESRLRESALKQERSEQHNRQLKSELKERVKQLTEHQVLNAELKQIINDLNANLKNPENRKLTRQMKRMVGKKATESALEEIAAKIDEFYPGLKSRLEEVLGKKKEAEIYTSLLYLMDYRTEDIAKLLQKTEKAVRSVRYRVRKKLDMPEEQEFNEGILSLHE